ncbi:MAG: polysaccharide biosynthesis C-terminal domain-containing protein [Planctomycetota bacterium]|nr:polysaccharide biosynthesis C-terminal domain-containing protein [Planctomycetota bacterium]
MASGLRDFAITFGSRAVIVLAGLGSQSCMAWLLGPAGRGSYSVAMLFTTVLSLIFIIGTDVAGRYFVSNGRFTISEGVSQILACGLLGCAVAVGVGLILMQLPLAFLSKASVSCFYLALVLIPLSFFSSALLVLLAALREFGWYAVVGIAGTLLGLTLNLVFLWGLRWDVEGAVLAALINNALTIVVVLAILRRKHGLAPVWPTYLGISEMFHYGIRYYAGKISNQANFQVGTIILAFFATREEIGLFSLAVTMTCQIMMVTEALGDVAMPRLAGDARGRPELVTQANRLVSLVSGPLLLVLAVFAEPIVTVLFSPEFVPMVPVIRVLAVGFFIRSATKMMEYYFMMTNRPGVSSTATTIGVVINLALLGILMPVIGLLGAAIAMTASFAFSGVYLILAFRRQSHMSLAAMWRYQRSDWAAMQDALSRIRGRLGRRTPAKS